METTGDNTDNIHVACVGMLSPAEVYVLDNMPDELFRQLTDPTADDYSGMRGYAKDITTQQKKLYMNGRLGIIIDGTGHKFNVLRKEKMELEKIKKEKERIALEQQLPEYR